MGDRCRAVRAKPEVARNWEDERCRVSGDRVEPFVAERVGHLETFGETAGVDVGPRVQLGAMGVQKKATLP